MKYLILFFLIIPLGNLWAYGLGSSLYNLEAGKHLLTAEFNGIVSEDGGIGIQARYNYRIGAVDILDTGFGIASGERSARFFFAIDHEIIPDYQSQPKATVQFKYERAEEYDNPHNILSIAPTVSKKFMIDDQAYLPFIALPMGLNLDSRMKRYESFVQIAIGTIGNIHFNEQTKFIGNIEVDFDLKDSFSGVTVGLSYLLD